MIISHKYQFIFIKTLKTAGTSIEIFLAQNCGADDIVTPIYPMEDGHCPRNYLDKDGTVKFHNHISAHALKLALPKEMWMKYYKFCFERNPWDKTLSHYYMLNFQNGYKLSFDDYMSKRQFCFNYPLYTEKSSQNIIVDRVAKYENLNEELTDIFAQIGLEFGDKLIFHAKASYRQDKRPYKEFFSGKYQKYSQVIQEEFHQEIKMHGYTFD
jgi:hypothetical protein